MRQRAKGIGIFMVVVVKEFLHDHGPLMAAAMSFFATLSLIPLLLVGVSALGYVFGSAKAFHDVMAFFDDYAPGPVEQTVRATLSTIVATRHRAASIGTVALLWTATNVFANMEAAMCITWNVERRPFWKSRPLAFSMMLLVGAGVFLSLGFTAMTLRIAGLKWQVFGYRVPDFPPLLHLAGYVAPVLIGVALFTAIYFILPNTRVKGRAAAAGGLFGGLLWQAALQSFRWYLVRFNHYDVLYGSLGSVVILVLWIYYSMIVLLLGAEVAWQTDQRLRAAEGRAAETPAEKLSSPAPLP